MKFDYNIKVTDNTPQLNEALEAWVERVLTIWGMKVQDYAQLLVPTGAENSTHIEGYVGGALKASLTYVVSAAQKTVTIGSNLFYSVYVELGTGIYATNHDGRKTPWVWQDFNGDWHFTRGMRAANEGKGFLRPAVEDHIKELQEIAVEEGNREV